jgi:hypothetical protein
MSPKNRKRQPRTQNSSLAPEFVALLPEGDDVVPFHDYLVSRAHIGFRNVGNLPAKKVCWLINAEMSEDARRQTFLIDEGKLAGSVVIPKGTDMRQFGEILPDAPLWNMGHFKDGLFFLYVWRIARYDVAENREDGTTMLLWGSPEVD